MTAFLSNSPRKHQRGVALIIVLALLVLIAGLIVGFMRRMSTERTSSAAYYEANQTALLADHAVTLVQAQLGHATGQKLAWATQPGMVRTFKADGSLSQAYKLYSDSAMVTDQVKAADALTALANWDQAPAHFVDLNAPFFRNPDAADKDPVYPILDPEALNAGIAGFNIDAAAPGTTTTQPAPMPVRWLYILEDGTTVLPTEATGATATIAGATAANPIIGRIAFWTDDESAKLNINTAGHGSFWDIPRAFSKEERDRMARFQPTLREFQRYPGHPATTSLWPALGHLFTNESAFEDFLFGVEGASLPGLSPRLRKGGSLSGTRSAATPIELLNPAPRLYTSVDELLFDPNRTLQAPLTRSDLEAAKFFLTARSNAPEVNLFNLPRMAIWPINSDTKQPSTLDELIAFCSTVNQAPYYLTRSNPHSTTEDLTQSNQNLYHYITTLLKSPFPGFGTTTFVNKYTSAEVDQITTEVFDYIRSSNLYSSALGGTPYTGVAGDNAAPQKAGSGVGQVAPLKIGSTKGVGRLPVLSKAVLHFYIAGLENSKGTRVSSEQFPSAALPKYSSTSTQDALMKTLVEEVGAGGSVTPIIRAIVYFDTFDPMYGYTFPRYKFEVDVQFSGTWTANGQAITFPSGTQTLQIDADHSGGLYNAKSHQRANTWMGRFLGGGLGPLWMMQNYSYLGSGHISNTVIPNKGGYPLVSAPLQPVAPIILENANTGSGAPIIALPEPPAANALNFSGGKVTAVLRVGSDVVQTYEFDFPGFTKPAPTYVERTYHRESSVAAQVSSVFKQMTANMDFRHRWNTQPQINRFHSPTTSNTDYDYVDLNVTPDFETVVSLEPAYGDKRLIAARSVLSSGGANASFVPHINYASNTEHRAVDLRIDPFGTTAYRDAIRKGYAPGRILDIVYGVNAMPDIPRTYATGVTTIGNFPPDFDNGTLHMPDDAYVNRADEGSSYDLIAQGSAASKNERYFAWYWDVPTTTIAGGGTYFNSPTFYSPNKQMSSAVMFGSLPTGAVRNHPWQTLLFRPDPGGHPGAAAGMPPDFLLLDLFWMPVVEPYAISEPFSTNGKVNMNYQIMPFSYIHRATAVMGLLHSQEILSIENKDAYKNAVDPITRYGVSGTTKSDQYKMYSEGTATDISPINFRRRLNLSTTDGTLRSFEERFKADRLFISEAEITTLPLIPSDATWSANFESAYWGDRRLTGDNSRETPYAHLLPRLTTRSNTYTVHYWVQSLRKPKSGVQTVWDSEKDRVVSELRGSRTIERYIDPAQNNIPNYSTATDPLAETSLEAFYRWRTLSNKEFRP